jgi:uncharacterized protein YndB with AHSA1/START domain
MSKAKLIQPDTLLVNRQYAAPRELVWKAWTEPESLKQWFGTPGYDLQIVEIDLRIGGAYRKVFRTPEGERLTVYGEYREVVEPERLVYTWSATGAGRDLRDSLVTVTLTGLGQETELTVRHEGLVGEDVIDRHRRGWTGNLDQLAGAVEGKD